MQQTTNDFNNAFAYQKYLESFVTSERLSKINRIIEDRTRHLTVVLEDVYQLHNSSAVLRTCEVFGIQDLHIIEQKFGKKIEKEIALGAQKWTTIHRYNASSHAVQTLKEKGYKIAATLPSENALGFRELPLHEPIALFFGTERKGITDFVAKNADYQIRIPMFGFTDSLNISVSAGILIQSLYEKLRNSNVQWRLTPMEAFELKTFWLEQSIKQIDSVKKAFFK